MTTREQILKFIRDCPYSPTVREIGEAVGLTSSSTVSAHLDRLERDGLIARGGPERDRLYAVKS